MWVKSVAPTEGNLWIKNIQIYRVGVVDTGYQGEATPTEGNL